jgi:predicted phage tail protein
MLIALDPRLAEMIGAPTEFEAVAETVAEAVACIAANFEPWKRVVSRLNFTVQVGRDFADESQLKSPISSKVRSIKFTIVPAGSGTVGKIVLGAALIGLGLFSGGIGFLGMSGTTTALLGGALILKAIFGGQKSPQDQERDGKKSNIFSRPQQTVTEGGRMPIVYGLHRCGWTIVSARVRNRLV